MHKTRLSSCYVTLWSFFLQRLHVRVVPFFLTKFHTHFETETPHQSFLMKLIFLSVPQQLLMCFLLNSRSLNPFKLAWDQSYKTTASAKKHFRFTAGCTLCIPMACLCIWCWIWQKLMWKICMEQRSLIEIPGLCFFFFFFILFSSKSLGISKLVFISFSRLWLARWYFTEINRTLAWNFYLLFIKLVGLLPCLNISPVDKMIFKIWTLLFSQKPDDAYIYYL